MSNYPNNILSIADLYDISNKLGISLNGIYQRDQIPSIHLIKGFYIINLDPTTSKLGGTHFTAFYNTDFDGENSIYFDSMGEICPLEVEQSISPLIYNHKQFQALSSSSCGFYCLAFIKYLSVFKDKQLGFKYFLELFSETDRENNEKIVYNILYKIK